MPLQYQQVVVLLCQMSKCQMSKTFIGGAECRDWTFKFHKVVRQQNSGVVEDFFSDIRSLSVNPKMKDLLKSVNICQSYHKHKCGTV